MASIWTPDELEEQIRAYKTASLAVAGGQSYRIEGRELTRADLPQIRDHLEWLGRELDKLKGSSQAVVVRMGGVRRW